MKRAMASLLLACGLLLTGEAQVDARPQPSIAMAPVGKVQVKPGNKASVELDFRVGSDFHINSNKPHSQLLIPTVLKLEASGPVSVSEIDYPAGQDQSFPFAPDEKLNVYSGDFSLSAIVKVETKAARGSYPVTGQLRFQACDRSACYPPRSIPVKFEVTVE